ncbi:hypothetical protein AB0J47_41930 [Nocardia sp. NPDC049737]|uniref:hypothetical protein n=1 Tax=Nocardia sp. NPDC049737 TaxID=3154358 RepID=UPI0034178EC8
MNTRSYGITPSADVDAVMACTECGAIDGMRHTHDLTDSLERKCGEAWACTECGTEYIDEW